MNEIEVVIRGKNYVLKVGEPYPFADMENSIIREMYMFYDEIVIRTDPPPVVRRDYRISAICRVEK